MISVGESHSHEDDRTKSDLTWTAIDGKRLFVLCQAGTLAENSHAQGRLLGKEIADGVLPEILDATSVHTDSASRSIDWIIAAVRRRMSDETFDACPQEFRDAADALGDGIAEALGERRFTHQQIRDAAVGFDVASLMAGFARRMQRPLADAAVPTFGYLSGAVAQFSAPRPETFEAEMALADRETIGRGVQKVLARNRRLGQGATAAGAAAALTRDGRALHAHALDTPVFRWTRAAGLSLIDERKTNPAWYRYAGIGPAGMICPAGLSGVNEAGLAVSLHRMQSVRYDTGIPGRGFATAPFLQQRILREAASLGEAQAILSGARHFSSWAVVVTDARAGRSARFEICGGTQTVLRTDLGDRFAQTNHFFDPSMAERNAFFDDLHFTPSFGAWLETRARFDAAQRAIVDGQAKGALGTDWAIDLLADHRDPTIGGGTRSLGRTVVRAGGVSGAVLRVDADRTRARDTVWISTGDATPAQHGAYAGFSIDWQALEAPLTGERAVRRAATVSDPMAQSLVDYVSAFETVARPKDARGARLGREPRNGEVVLIQQKALALVDRATRRLDDAGQPDFALLYARARLNHAVGMIDAAAEDCALLQRSVATHPSSVHDYDRALLYICAAATEFAATRVLSAKALLDQAEGALARTMQSAFPPGSAVHEGLLAWRRVIDDLRANGEAAVLPEFDFETFE